MKRRVVETLLLLFCASAGLAACGDEAPDKAALGDTVAGDVSDATSTAPDAGDAAPGDASDQTPPAGDGEGVSAETGEGSVSPHEKLAALVGAEMISLGVPGCAVALVQGGEVTFARGFGVKSRGGEEAIDAETLFRIGSVTKVMTAIGLLQRVEAGEIDLAAPITDYLPTFSFARDPGSAAAITVRHLLTHSSGMVDAGAVFVPDEEKTDEALETWLLGPYAAQAYLMAPPGRMFNYSNPNFIAAGLLIYMRQRLFEPLGMDRTYLLPEEVLADGNYASGMGVDEAGRPAVVGPGDNDVGWARPAGWVMSSVLDLARFAGFLLHGDDAVLGAALRAEVTAPQVDTEQMLDLAWYGYGLQVQEGFAREGAFYPHRVVSHGGQINGFSAWLGAIPALDVAFVSLANGEGADFSKSFMEVLPELTDIGPPVEQVPDLSVDPGTFSTYAGTYNDPWFAGDVIVSLDGDDLVVEVPLADTGGVPYQRSLEPLLPHVFLSEMEGKPLLVTFLFDEEGSEVEYLRTRAFVARKTGEPAPP